MPGPFHGWMYLRDQTGTPREIFNHARTAAYLKNPALSIAGISVCDILEFGGCQGYAYEPPCDIAPPAIEFPGTAGNGLTVPDAAALDITAEIILTADVALDDWTSGSVQVLAAKAATAGQFSYALSISATGVPTFHWSVAGTTVVTLAATENVTGRVADGERLAIKVDFDNNFGGVKQALFSTAPTHEGPWQGLGTAVTQAGTTSIFSGTSLLSIGYSSLLAGPMNGMLYRFVVRSGAGGATLVLDVDPDVLTTVDQTSFAALTGQIVTVLRSGSPQTVLHLGEEVWEPHVYLSPAVDGAPWYNANYPQSADCLGFFVEEWTGLDNRHVQRKWRPARSAASWVRWARRNG